MVNEWQISQDGPKYVKDDNKYKIRGYKSQNPIIIDDHFEDLNITEEDISPEDLQLIMMIMCEKNHKKVTNLT